MSDLRVMPEIDQVVVKPGPLGLFLSQNVHDDGLLPSVMKSLGTESMRGRVKAFSLLRVSVPPWPFSFTAKSTKKRFSIPSCS